MPGPYDRELELCRLAARPNLTESESARAIELFSAGLDWSTLQATATFHLLMPRLCALAETVGNRLPEVSAALRGPQIAGVARNLQLTGNLSRVQRLLDAAGIPILTIKGPVLAVDGYGDLSQRWFYDVDILVQRANAIRAIDVLMSNGWAPKFELTGRWTERYVRRFYELSLWDASGVNIDLHWFLVDPQHSFAPAEADVWTNTRTVSVNGQTLTTLSVELTAVYLCLHVAKHHWDRVGWLADLAFWGGRHPELDWARLAKDPLTGRFVLVALGLVELLLVRCLTPGVNELISQNPVVQAQIDVVAARLLHKPGIVETTAAPWRTEFARIMPRSSDRLKMFCSMLFQPSILEWLEVPLPEALTPLYAVIRPWRLFKKRVTTAVGMRHESRD